MFHYINAYRPPGNYARNKLYAKEVKRKSLIFYSATGLCLNLRMSRGLERQQAEMAMRYVAGDEKRAMCRLCAGGEAMS